MATTKTTKKPKKPAQPQPAEALSPHSTEAAFKAVKAQLDALAVSELSQPNFDLQDRASDVKLARELADKIIAALGGPSTPEATQWRNYQARAFPLLDRHHQEAIRVGRFLSHYERGDELFPTMFAAVRSRPARKASPEAEPAPPAPASPQPA